MSYASTAVNGVKQATTTTAYANAVKNLSLRQAELALSTKNLSAEQQREILVTAGLIKETGTLTVAQATEALTTDTRNAADVEALMLKAGLITELGAETTATITVDAAKLKELVDTKVLTQAEAELLAMKAGVTLQSTKEAATLIASNAKLGSSFAIMGKTAGAALKGIGTGLLSFASAHPLIAALVGVVSIVGLVTTGTKKLREEQEQAIETARSLQEEYRSSTKSLSDNISSLESQKDEFERLSKGVDDYGKNISLSSDEYDRYKSIVSEILGYSPELIQGYDAEGNAIANKNSLIERSIELMKEEQRQKLKEMTTDEKTKTAYEGAKADWEQTKGYEGANTRNEIARFFRDHSHYNDSDFAKALGMEDLWKEFKSDHPNWGIENFVIENIEDVTKAIKENKQALLDLKDTKGNKIFTSEDIEGLIGKADTWEQQYADWQQDIENAKHGMDDQFELYAQKAEGYNDLTDAQKAFVNEYIKATGDIIDADGNLLSEDEIIEKAEGYTKFVEKLAKDPNFEEARTKINTLFSLDKSKMSASEYEKQVNAILKELQDKFNLTDDEVMDFKIALGFTFTSDGKTQTGELLDQVKGKLKDEFDGKADELTLEELQIAAKIVADIPEGTLLSWDELQKKIKETQGNANKMTDSLKPLNESLDKIQSAYQAVESAIEEYNKEGYLSVDTFQSLIGLEPQYLNMLLDENGNLNLNTDAVNENTRAYLQNLGIKSAESMLDTLTTYSSEAEQLDYLSGALNTNTQETWANVYAKLEQLKVDGKITDAVYNSAHARLDAYKKMTDDAIAGIGKGGLGKSASDTSDKIKDTKKQLDDLAKTEALDALKYKFDQLEQSIEKVDNAMSLLDTTLDLQAENDYVGKLETVTRQLDLAQQKSALLRDEFAQLSNTQYSTADEANELATRMKSVADSIADNSKNIIEYGKSITEYYMSAMSSIGSMADASIERATSLFERNVKTLQEGGLTGLQFNLSPIVPQSAFEKQRQENRNMEDEMRSYYDTVAEMQKTALDMQYQETVADNERKRQELLGSLNEAMSAQQSYSIGTQSLQKSTNNATSQEQVQDDKEKLAEQESFISSMKDNMVGLNDWMIENPIKAPELDDSWQKLVSETNDYVQRIKDAFNESSNSAVVDIAKQFLGTPYKWGGTSPDGFDCSGLVQYVYSQIGKSIPRTSQGQFLGGTNVSSDNLQPGDLVFFKGATGSLFAPGHVGLYIGNGQYIQAPKTGDVVKISNLSDRKDYAGARRYAKGTKDFAVYGDNINGVAGENYKPEILINKKTGDMIPIDEPTFVDTNKYDVVGEKTTAKVLPRYATGTPTTDPEILSYIKRASEATGVPANIIMAVMDQETGYKWYDSVSDGTAYSHGYMMLYDNGALAGMDAQRKQLAITDKYTNVLEGAKLLASNYQRYGDWQTAITRYNGSGSAANKYGQQVWSRANSQAFIDAANNIDSIASYTESTADNTVAIRKSFDSQFRDFIEGANSISNSKSVEDSLMNYIKTNTEISSDSTEKFIEAFEGLNAYKDSMEPYFNEKREEIRNTAGTPEFIALTNAYNKEHSEYIDAILGYSTDMTVAQTKAQYKLTEDAIKKGYEYYNERKNAGASATELMEIITKLGEIEKVAEEYSDAYVQAISAETDFLVSRTERTLNAFENEMSWLDKDLEKAEGDTVKQSEIYGKKNGVSRRAMDAAHQRVLEIRQDEDYADILSTYDVESWFDASGELTSKFYSDVEGASSELIPYMNQFAEIVGVCKKEWYENAEAIESNNEAMADLKVEEYIRYQERLVESLDFNASISQSLSTAKEGMYNIFKTLRDEKAEMDKELKANMQIDDWLTKDTRDRLFNTEDYEKQMGVINDIEAKAQSLYATYQNDLANLREDELYKEEEITAEYNRQLEKLQDKLSIAKADLQLAKDKAAFENTLKERDTQIIIGNGVQNVADPERLREAAMKVAESESALENEKTTSAENQDIRNMEATTGMINQEKGAIQNRIDMINGMTEEERKVFADFLEPLQVYRNRILALTKTNPYRIITGDNSNDVFMSRDYSKIEGYSLTQDHSSAVDEIQHLLDNGYYKQGTPEYDVALKTIDILKKQHDDKTTSDAHNYGYDLYDPANSVNWYRYMKMYTDLGYAIQSQERPSVDETMLEAYEDAANNLPVISGEGEILVSANKKPHSSTTFSGDGDISLADGENVGINEFNDYISQLEKEWEENTISITPYSGLFEDYKEVSLAEMISPLLDDSSMAESIAQSIVSGAIAPNIDTIASVFSRAQALDLIKNGNNDNSIHMQNVNVTLEKPVADPNDFIQQLISKVNSEYSTTNNQR